MTKWNKADCITVQGAARRINVKRATIDDWISQNKIECRDGYVLLKDIENIGQEIGQFISLEAFLQGVNYERFDSRYVKNRNKFIDYLEENDFLGIKVFYPDEMTYVTDLNASFYFHKSDLEELEKRSEVFFRFFGFSEKEKSEILVRECRNKTTRKMLSQYLDRIETYTPLVTHFVEEATKIDLKDISNKTAASIISEMKYVGSKDIFIAYLAFAKEELKIDIGSISRKQNHTTKDIGAYPYKKYVAIAKNIFNEELLAKNQVIKKSFEKSINFETWLFLCAHFVCGWRASDICDNWPCLRDNEIKSLSIDVDNLPKDIINNTVEERTYFEIGEYIEKSIEIAAIKAHKTGKASDLIAPIGRELKAFFGRMALISYYLQSTSGEGRLQAFRIGDYLNYVRLKELFGDELYKELGRSHLSSRRLNKSFLQSMEMRARKDGAGTMAAYTIASMARNHSNIDTTAIYLYDNGLTGETAEVVLSMMMDRGVFGSVVYAEFLAAFPDVFEKLSAKEQTQLIAECNVSAYELETMAAELPKVAVLKKRFAEGESKKVLKTLYEMFEIAQGFGKSKDAGVYCKKRALGEACENPLFEHCVLNACPYAVFTESGIRTLIDVINTYSKLADETGHPKYKRVLYDVIIPIYKDIIKEFAEQMTPNEAKALKALIGNYYGKHSKNS